MIRIIDLSQHAAGSFAAQLLAELGADVIKVEPPAGDPQREAVALDDEDASFDYANRRKRSVTLDPRRRAGRALLLRLIEQSDAVIETFAPRTLGRIGLSFRAMQRANPRVVLTSVTPFGQSGPRRDWQSSELVLQALGGIVAATGWEDSAPLKLAGRQAAYIAGINAATATMAALYGIGAGTTGAIHLDVAIQETLPPHWARHVAQDAYSGTVMQRQPSRENGRQGFPDTAMTADGSLYLLALRAEWESFAHFLGLDQFVTHEWSDPTERARRWSEIEPHFRASIASKTTGEWVGSAAERGYTFAPLDGPREILASPQLQARGFFDTAMRATGAPALCPSLPFRSEIMPAGDNRAPALGEHTEQVLAELLGISDAERAALRMAGAM